MAFRITSIVGHGPSRSLFCKQGIISRPAFSLARYRPRLVPLSQSPQPGWQRSTVITPVPLRSSPSSTDPETYTPPTSGLLSHFPSSLVPYAELIRLDKPTGVLYLFTPCLWSTLLAGTLSDPTASPSSVVTAMALFATGALIMRGAGCTINDLWDRRIDPQITRTRFRPLARGAITPISALCFTSVQLLAGLALLLQFPVEAVACGIPSLVLVAVYPLMKRVTHYPQFVLGLAFSWGALLGFPALGLSLMDPTSGAAPAAACLYGSSIAWTVLYDTIYAHQDVKDDVKAGVKSIVVKHRAHTKILMTTLGVVQVGLLASAGAVCGCGPVFYAVSCAGSAGALAYMVRKVDLEDVKQCWYWFKWCAWAVGIVTVGGGLAGEYVAVWSGVYGEEGWWGIGGSRRRMGYQNPN